MDNFFENTAENTAETVETETENQNSSEQAESLQENGETQNAQSESNEGSEDKNAVFAKARREAERKYKSYRSEVDSYFKAKGFSSFEDFKKSNDENELNKALEEEIPDLGVQGSVLRPTIEAIVSNMPEVKAAREIVLNSEAQKEEEALNGEIAKIHELDPSINSVQDLFGMDNADEFNDMVINRKYGLFDAYRILNFDRLMDSKGKAAEKSAVNKINSKNHMVGLSGTASSEVSVPADVKELYKCFNPNASDSEILEHYKKSLEG